MGTMLSSEMHVNIRCMFLCDKSFLWSVDILRIISGGVRPLAPEIKARELFAWSCLQHPATDLC